MTSIGRNVIGAHQGGKTVSALAGRTAEKKARIDER
jgi:hypothetical protein